MPPERAFFGRTSPVQVLVPFSRVTTMRFKGWSIIGAAALIAAPLAPSNAQYAFGSSNDVCGGSSFTFCLAISAAQGTGANANNFFITITNEALHGSNAAPYSSIVFTALGFNGFASAPSFSSPAAGTSFESSDDIQDLSNFSGTWVGAEANNPPPKLGLLFGESITFMFANTTASTFDASDLAIHAQAGPGGCSSKLEIDLSHAAPSNGSDFVSTSCGGTPPITSTPEPASLALMATGLLALGGILRLRRNA